MRRRLRRRYRHRELRRHPAIPCGCLEFSISRICPSLLCAAPPCIRQEPYRPKLAATCLMGSCWPCAPGRFAALKERCAAWEFYHEDYAYNHFPAITGRLYGLSAGGGVWALMPDAGQGVGDRFPSFSRWRWRPILLAFGPSHVLQESYRSLSDWQRSLKLSDLTRYEQAPNW